LANRYDTRDPSDYHKIIQEMKAHHGITSVATRFSWPARDVRRAICDLRDIWNRYIDSTERPDLLKFHEEEPVGRESEAHPAFRISRQE
jgi:hypothetical protein